MELNVLRIVQQSLLQLLLFHPSLNHYHVLTADRLIISCQILQMEDVLVLQVSFLEVQETVKHVALVFLYVEHVHLLVFVLHVPVVLYQS